MFGFGSNKTQKDKIAQFKKTTGCTDDKIAENYLKKTKWDLNSAVSQYNTDHPKDIQPKKLISLFEKYEDKNTKQIELEGVQNFLSDLGLDPMDPLTLVISYKMKAKTMGVFTKEEFLNGLSSLGCETISELKSKLPNLKKDLDVNSPVFKEIYKYTFNYAKEELAKNLNYDSAIALWKILLEGKFPFLNELFEFLESKTQKTDITKDQWVMLLEFHYTTKGDTSNYEDDGAWPTLIDDLVEFIRQKGADKKII